MKEPLDPTQTVSLPTNSATLVAKGRQANPDIQDIITGIVKLLNGNVNVQANTAPAMGRPLRPLSTRINNRGPPRITDLPIPPHDYDISAPPLPPPPLGQMTPPVVPTRMPTPYPFDIPHTSPVKRPGIYRPLTIPPWNRRKPTRKPITSYVPIPPGNPVEVSLTSEKPLQDILTLDLGVHLQPQMEDEIKVENNINLDSFEVNKINMTDENVTFNSTSEDEDIAHFEKNKEKSTSKMTKHTSVTPSPQTMPITSSNIETTVSTKTENKTAFNYTSTKTKNNVKTSTSTEPSTSIKPTIVSSTSTVSPNNISSTVIPVSSTTNTVLPKETIAANKTTTQEETPTLESSIQEVLQTLKEDFLSTTTLASTPTEQLPTIVSITSVIQTTTTASGKLSSCIYLFLF